jgi:hypothetical protein
MVSDGIELREDVVTALTVGIPPRPDNWHRIRMRFQEMRRGLYRIGAYGKGKLG